MADVTRDSNEEERLLSHSERGQSSPERGYDSMAFINEESYSILADEAGTTFDESTTAKKLPQYTAAFSATLSAFAAGIVLGWTSPISTELENGQYNNISVNATEMGWIGSFSTIGALVMCLPTGYLCDLLGRRTLLALLVLPATIGWTLLIYANSLIMLYIGRFVNGIVVGACCIAAPLYTSEISQKEIRGTLGSYFQLMITAGIFYAYLVGKFLSPVHYTVTCSLIPAIACIALVFQPETPLFHVKKGNLEKARIALKRLRGINYNVEIELNSIESGIKDSTHSYTSVMSVFQQRATLRALLIAFGLMFFQQFCGINAVVFYTGDIFKSSGIKFDPKLATIFVGGFQVLATFISSLVVDRLGRRKLLMLSAFVMSIASLLLGIFNTLKQRDIINNHNISSYGALPVVSLCVFVIVFSLGFGPIPWMISSEIFTPELKSKAGSAAGAFNWFLAFLITKFYLNVADSIGEDNTFYAFSGISLIGVIFVYFVVIETKGKTIGQIQAELGE